MELETILDRFSERWSTHHLAPSLVLSSINRDGEKMYYASIHTFPNGMNSRRIVCKATEPTLEAAVKLVVAQFELAGEM